MSVLRVFIAAAVLLTSCTKLGIFEPNEIDKLVLYMDSKYFRNIDNQPFSLHYRSVPPEIIVIEVRYYPEANLNLVNSLVESSRETIRRVASEEYKFKNLEIQTDIKSISRPTKQQIIDSFVPDLPPIMVPKKKSN